MKASDLRDLSQAELEARLNDEKTAIQDLNFKKAIAGQIENPSEIRFRRRLIARIHTVIREKQSAN